MNTKKWMKNFRSAFALTTILALPFLFSSSAQTQQSFLTSSANKFTAFPPGMAVSRADLRNCFLGGTCKATPPNEIYQYPMTCEGSGTSECSGCWERTGVGMVRKSDLDANGKCAANQTRIYLGYRMECPSVPSPGACTNGRLLLGCSISGAGSGMNAASPYFGECFNGNAIVVDPTNLASLCDAGTYRSLTTGDCTSCPSGQFKSKSGDSVSLCQDCTGRKFYDADGKQIGSATNPTGTGSDAWTSSAQCQYADIKCDLEPTHKDYVASGQECIKRTCTLGMTYVSKNPDSTSDKNGPTGMINVALVGVTGTPHTSIGASGGSSTSMAPNFSGLSAGDYTISTTDDVCTRTTTVTLVDAPSCSMGLSTTIIQPTAKTDGSSNEDGSIKTSITGAIGKTEAKISYSAATVLPDAGSNPVTFGKLSAGTYTISVKDTVCTQQIGAILTQGLPTCLAGTEPKDNGCAPCAVGSFKEADGNTACTKCSATPPNIFNGSLDGTTFTTSATGSKTRDSCRVSYSCNTGYQAASPTTAATFSQVGCNSPILAVCNLQIASVASTPATSSTSSDGAITVTAGGKAGPLTWTAYTPPNANDPTGGGPEKSGRSLTYPNSDSAKYSGIPSGMHTITVNDSAAGCGRNVDVLVAEDTPIPSPTPPPTCMTLALTAEAARSVNSGSISATVSGAVGNVVYTLNPPNTAGAASGAGWKFSGLYGKFGGITYSVTAKDDKCTTSSQIAVGIVNVCQNLCGGAGMYYADVADFGVNRVGHQAYDFNGDLANTCQWEKTDGTLFGSPYVTCGSNRTQGNQCTTTKGARPFEQTYYLQYGCVRGSLGCSCSDSNW